MWYVYVLQSLKDKNFYTGCTNNLRKRLEEHNRGLVLSTKDRGRFKLLYYESCINREDAFRREKYLKTAWGKRYIKNRVRLYLKSI